MEVRGLAGGLALEMPEGTQTGTVFRIAGEGMPHLDGNGRGDQYVVVKVVTPTGLTKEARYLPREFERLRQESGDAKVKRAQ